MKNPFPPPPPRARLARELVHVVVRDFPETLPLLRGRGVDVAAVGASPLSEAEEGGEGVVDAVLEATSWRATPLE